MISLDHVSASYDGGGSFAVCDITIEIEAGQFVALTGPSGCGKTSLLKLINRLHEPMSGEVRIAGVPVRAEPPEILRRSIGYVFQGIGLFPHFTVAENIAITPKLLGWSATEQAERVSELLALVELPQDFANRMPAQLSGGQQQRVAVARALAARPKILLMDEPFAALDPVTRDALGTACRNLHLSQKLTTIMVTHDMQEAMLLADRIIVMRDGIVAGDGAPGSLQSGLADPALVAMMELPLRQAKRVQALIDSGLDAP